MSQLKRIVTKAENCFQRCVIELRKTRGSAGIPIDFYLNTCLDCVEMVNKLPSISKKEKVVAREKIFAVYFKLQKYKGSERQTTNPYPIGKETHMETIDKSQVSTNAYKGGLGFSGVADGLFLQKAARQTNPYWKPTKKDKVKTLPKEDHLDIMEEYEERRLDDARLTMAEFREEMDREKRELLYELRQLREGCNPNKKRVPIM
tara:strand:+ start:111 stop:722 length:612 start_codon:yes stop_codon:yes gene_type:complete